MSSGSCAACRAAAMSAAHVVDIMLGYLAPQGSGALRRSRGCGDASSSRDTRLSSLNSFSSSWPDTPSATGSTTLLPPMVQAEKPHPRSGALPRTDIFCQAGRSASRLTVYTSVHAASLWVVEPPKTMRRPPSSWPATASSRGVGAWPASAEPDGSVEPLTYCQHGAPAARSSRKMSLVRRRTEPEDWSPPNMKILEPVVVQSEWPSTPGGCHAMLILRQQGAAVSRRSRTQVSFSRLPASPLPPKTTIWLPSIVQDECQERGSGGLGTDTWCHILTSALMSSRYRSFREPWAPQPPKRTTQESRSHLKVWPHRPCGLYFTSSTCQAGWEQLRSRM
mmetsp:Transcript_12979/g.32839  ORF Transcript_12979/g.32839 Transcript_12979/m.32839 type:complete len:336 (-) Transcript_12979:1439-2446(-)